MTRFIMSVLTAITVIGLIDRKLTYSRGIETPNLFIYWIL
jgi:hypothetical protein